jgi:mRNA (guanine-N7-)-methyltransferase
MSYSNENKTNFYNMKKFHNNIKRDLIKKYAKNNDTIIDLGCGKGGDMHKWISTNIKYVKGYDINKEYLKEAEDRYEKIKKQNKINTEIIYKCIDLSKKVIDTEHKNVNIITCNFALHYFFENEETFNILKKSIKNNLKINGYFIGTIFDGASVNKMVNNYEFTQFDKLFKIENINNNNKLFGNKIKVYLKDSIIDNISYEYLIYFGKFISKMEDEGFILVNSKLFSEIDDFNNLEDYEKSYSSLNRYFVFKLINNNIDCITYDFNNMKVHDLKEFCKNNNINNYSKFNKKDLIIYIHDKLKNKSS